MLLAVLKSKWVTEMIELGEIELSEDEKAEYINELRFISAVILMLFGITMLLAIRYLEYKHEITCSRYKIEQQLGLPHPQDTNQCGVQE